MKRGHRTAAVAACLLPCVLFALPAWAQKAVSPESYINFTMDILQLKLKDGGADAVGRAELSETEKPPKDFLSDKGEVTVLGRFESTLIEGRPTEMESQQQVTLVRPESFEERRYEQFATESVGSVLTVSAVRAGTGTPYKCALTLKADVSSIVAWMKDGNPVIVSASITGMSLTRKGENAVFSALIAADEYESRRAPLHDFARVADDPGSPKPVAYQIFVIVSLEGA